MDTLPPPHLDKAQKAPIDKLYVTPNFIPSSIKNAEHQNPLTYDDFVRELYRVVLLGNPGAGKSTLANKLCHDLSKPTNPITNDGLVITPVIVILREYANEKKNKGISVMQYIEQRSNSHYQVEAPKHAFEYMILNGKAVVIFDGLDELLNTSYRKEISDDVQSFCNLYPTVPVLVTSREVGYEQAPLDHSIFNEFRLSPFDDEQVLSYAKKWFMVDGEIDDKAGQSKAEAFFNESQSVFDLRSNPLLLSLMCNLYRGENYIPKNRPDVYEKCALMLFERWDKGRGIKVDLPFEEHIKPSMNHIAYWLYSENGSNAVAAESKLIQRTSQYLIGKRFEDEDEAKFAAVQFIEFCSGRAWVFTDVGTTESGERLFQFTHRTFLEYFTALDIIRNNPTPKQLITFLIDRIKAVEWDVVCQLSFQILNKNVEGASGKLFELLFDCKQSSSSKQWQSIVTFANRCLSFLVPPPAITRRLVKYTLQQCCSITSSKKSILTSLWRNALVELMNATHENLGPISNELGTTIEESLKSNDKSATIMIEILIEIETVVRDFSPISNSRQNEAFWNNFREALFQKHKTLILNRSSNDLNNSIRLFFKDEFTLNELIANHGLSSIYKRGNFYLSDNISYIPPVLGAILTVVKSTMREEDDNGQIAYRDRRKQLIELGQNVIQSELPIEFHMDHNIDIRDLFHTRRYNPKEYEAETFIVKSNGNILFGVFIALAISIELDTKHKLLTMIESNASVLTQIFKDIFKHRYGGNFTYEAKNLISLIDFDHNQLNFINKWARKEVSIVKPIRTCKGKDSKKPGTRNQENEENEENEG